MTIICDVCLQIAILRRLILCLRDKNYISDKVRHWFQTVLWWNSFTFLVCFVHLIQRNLNTSHMFAVCIPEGFLFLSGCSACLRMDGGNVDADLAHSYVWYYFILADGESPEKLLQTGEGRQHGFCKLEQYINPIFISELSILSWVMSQIDTRTFSGDPLLIYNVFIIDKTENAVWPKCWANNCKAWVQNSKSCVRI